MKKITSLVCMLFVLLTSVAVPSALAMDTDYSGDWVCVSVDLGDGVLQTEYEGQSLQEVITFTLRTDGTVLFNSFGTEVEGVWAPTGGGISVVADNMAVPFTYTDNQLVNTEDGVTMYFVRAEEATKSGGLNTLLSLGIGGEDSAFSFAGTWKAVSYIAMGTESDVSQFFPDGFTLTLLEDGTGTVQLTAAYAEPIVWENADGGITLSNSNFLYNPVWDPETGILTFNYASDVIQITFEKEDAGMADTAGDETANEEAGEPSALPQEYSCAYFSAAFPEGWAQDEYNTYNWDTYYSVQYNLEDKDGWTQSTVRVTASEETVAGYRDKLDTLLAYAKEQGKDQLDELTISGIPFQGLTYTDYGTYTSYTARIPEASLTLGVEISSPDTISDVLPGILGSILFTYTVPNPPLADPPLPEDGTPYQPSAKTISVGGFDLKAKWLPIAASVYPKSGYGNSLAAVGDTLYILNYDKLYVLGRSGDGLALQGEPIQLDNTYNSMSAADDGTLYLTDGYYDGLTYKDGVFGQYDVEGYLAIHPEGKWGLNFWYNSDVKKITNTADGLAVKNWALTGLSDDALRTGRFSTVDFIKVTSENVFVAGYDTLSNNTERLAMYDLDGNEIATFGGTDWSDDSTIGSVSGVLQTKNGILVQDATYQAYKLFALDGTFLGSVSCDELLGTEYPWPYAMVDTDGGALVLLSQERNDQSATELLVFEITGF